MASILRAQLGVRRWGVCEAVGADNGRRGSIGGWWFFAALREVGGRATWYLAVGAGLRQERQADSIRSLTCQGRTSAFRSLRSSPGVVLQWSICGRGRAGLYRARGADRIRTLVDMSRWVRVTSQRIYVVALDKRFRANRTFERVLVARRKQIHRDNDLPAITAGQQLKERVWMVAERARVDGS